MKPHGLIPLAGIIRGEKELDMLNSFFEIVMVNGAIILVVAAVIIFFTRKAYKNRYNLRDQFIGDELEANTARRRDVEPEFYFTPDIKKLPVRDNSDNTVNEDIKKKQEKAVNCAGLTMVRFPEKLTNIELKNSYGVANLEKITGYEENYDRYVSALIDWSEALINHGGQSEKLDAVTILEHTVELGSEYRKTYTHLADHYHSKVDFDKLNFLLDKVSELFEDEGIKKQLTQYIMDKKESL